MSEKHQSEEEEQMKRLKQIALDSTSASTWKKVMETLATYGEKAIPVIADIIAESMEAEIRDYGLDVIKKIREKSTNTR